MLFGGLQKTTLVDYPGKVAATIFTTGCNFRCPYCHNPELVLPELIKKQPKITEKEILDFLKERQKLLEGVCITGGEPTIQSDLIDFIKKVKDLGFLVKLDTNGSCSDVLNSLIERELIDYVAMDIKAPKQKYELFVEDEN
ncbi:anaerobic ribonucleoside-triphosphate reductase activating protein, partial [bacterium]